MNLKTIALIIPLVACDSRPPTSLAAPGELDAAQSHANTYSEPVEAPAAWKAACYAPSELDPEGCIEDYAHSDEFLEACEASDSVTTPCLEALGMPPGEIADLQAQRQGAK
jgi:hypothetical protein